MQSRNGKLMPSAEIEAFDAGVASASKPLVRNWKHTTAKYGSGEELWIGKIKVGSWHNPSISKGDPTIYRAFVHLPTIVLKSGTIDFDNREDAKARVERAVDTWFRWLGEE